MDEAEIQKTLREWASAQKLSSASLSEDGLSLTLDSTTLPADTVLSVSHEGKTCSYTLASIYLQVLDPDQALLGYRNACKKHNVKDPIKPIDKPTVLGSILGVSKGLASEAAPPSAVAQQAPAPEEQARKKQKKDHHKKGSSRHKEHSSKRKAETSLSSKKAKKPKELVTNEQLFDRLNVVVDKRQVTDQRKQDIARLLSAEGFSVTPELLQEHRAKTKAILAQEIPVGNSASILRAVNPRKDLSRILQLFQGSSAAGSSTSNRHNKPSSSSSSKPGLNATPQPSAKPLKKHLLGKKPIIIVPKGMTGAITIANAHDFLCNARFTPRDVLVKEGRHRNPQMTFTRTVRGSTGTTGLLEYEILDNPRKLGNNPHEWDRVVAVLVLGQAWQFKDWLPPQYNAPATLFDRVYGFFIGLEGAKMPPDLKGWAVKHAFVNRDKRGLDQVAYASFWNGLDEWMRVRKPELLPQTDT